MKRREAQPPQVGLDHDLVEAIGSGRRCQARAELDPLGSSREQDAGDRRQRPAQAPPVGGREPVEDHRAAAAEHPARGGPSAIIAPSVAVRSALASALTSSSPAPG